MTHPKTTMNNTINTKAISVTLDKQGLNYNIEFLPETDSTNAELKRAIYKNQAGPGNIIIADSQTQGRGRRGKTWYSPSGEALYMSICVASPKRLSDAPKLVIAAAVAMIRALRPIVSVKIKWPNDIFLNDLKLCGIMSELITEKNFCCAIIGIGLNLYQTLFPQEISNTAISLKKAGVEFDVNRLISSIIWEIDRHVKLIDERFDDLLSDFSASSLIIDTPVRIIRADSVIDGIVKGFDKNGLLILKAFDGRLHIIDSGDVSLRRNLHENHN